MLILYEIDIAAATSTRDSPTPLCENNRLMQWILIAHILKGKNEPPKQLKLLIGLCNVILKEKNEPTKQIQHSICLCNMGIHAITQSNHCNIVRIRLN